MKLDEFSGSSCLFLIYCVSIFLHALKHLSTFTYTHKYTHTQMFILSVGSCLHIILSHYITCLLAYYYEKFILLNVCSKRWTLCVATHTISNQLLLNVIWLREKPQYYITMAANNRSQIQFSFSIHFCNIQFTIIFSLYSLPFFCSLPIDEQFWAIPMWRVQINRGISCYSTTFGARHLLIPARMVLIGHYAC